MISIICQQVSNRLTYTSDIIFNQLLNIPYQLIPSSNYNPNTEDHIIEYGTPVDIPRPNISIPNAGLLYESGIKDQELRFYQADIPYLFYQPSVSESKLDFDIFSAVFYLLTEYEKYEVLHLDLHGRYIRNEYPSHRLQLNQFPLVHLYVEYLRKALQKRWPDLTFETKNKFDYEITIDVDVPWKYLNKGIKFLVGGGIKQLIKKDWKGLKERFQAFYTGQDPNFTFDQIYQICPPEKTTFFFLVSKNSEFDSRFTLASRPYQKLIHDIQKRDYAIGIHPSYDSYLSPKVIYEEKEALEKLLNISIDRSRQHFLKYRLPDTFRHLEAAGIRHEYTICDFQEGGFPTGMAQPYLWYDLKEERISNIWLHPTIIMDWSLLHYMSLSPGEVIKEIQVWLEICKRYHGIFTILIHNDSLSESHPWIGWRKEMIKTIEMLKSSE